MEAFSLTSVTGQSTRHVNILLINPNSTQHMTDACLDSVKSRLPTNVTVYGFTGPKSGPTAIEGKVDATISAADCFRVLAPHLKARSGFYHGFLVACFSFHPLIAMLREEYQQPTIGIMEAALYGSRLCGNKFGIVTTSERSSVLHAHSAAVEYGLRDFSVGTQTGHISVLELESRPPEEVYQGLVTAAKELVDRGADCVCLGCAGMTGMHEVVSEAVGMPEGKVVVVDGVAMGVHFLASLAHENMGTAKATAFRSSAAGRKRRGQNWL